MIAQSVVESQNQLLIHHKPHISLLQHLQQIFLAMSQQKSIIFNRYRTQSIFSTLIIHLQQICRLFSFISFSIRTILQQFSSLVVATKQYKQLNPCNNWKFVLHIFMQFLVATCEEILRFFVTHLN